MKANMSLVNEQKKGKMTVQEAGRKGGEKTAEDPWKRILQRNRA